MPIQRLNHAVLHVRDVSKAVAFYTDVLGFRVTAEMSGRAAFLQAAGSTNDHDLGLFAMGPQAAESPAGRTAVGLYHLAWEVDTLGELRNTRAKLVEHGALVGESDHGTTKALYARDVDGIEFEVCWLVPADQLTDELRAFTGSKPLDLDAEIAGYGADRRGGVGVSVPASS
ncbi:VOC family protein [Umezawaea sp.]|uniref:VOC family protein n=1 Tax=Umezawaea sp. TaxID=1955258 RepID=UPI002ED47AE0